MEPTQKQIKEFWERCGVPEPEIFINQPFSDMLPIDLNNLFKYAERPILLKQGRAGWLHLLNEWVYEVAMNGKDPAPALFWVLDKVREDGQVQL